MVKAEDFGLKCRVGMVVSAGEQCWWSTRELLIGRMCFEMLNDTRDDRRLGDNADDVQSPTTSRTVADIDVEDAL